MDNKNSIEEKETLMKQLKIERITNIIMVIILLICVLAMGFMVYTAVSKSSSESTNSSSNSTVEPVEPGVESTETISYNGVDYEINVPGTLDFSSYDETKYIGENGRYKFNTADFIENPDFELPEFSKTSDDYIVAESEIDTAIEELANSYSEYTKYDDTEKVIADGDTVVVSYEAYKDGTIIPSVSDTEANVIIGSDNYIPGFEDALIGHKAGEEFSANITFPETYTSDGTANGEPSVAEDEKGNSVTLTGNTFEFKFKIESVGTTKIPEITDDWVAKNLPETSGLSIDTVDKLRDYYRCIIYYNELITDVNNYIVDEVMPNIKFKSVPTELMEFVYMNGLYQYYNYGNSTGLDIDTTVYTYTGMNVHDFLVENLEQSLQQALQLMTWDLVYEKVVELGSADVSKDEDFRVLMNEIMGIELSDSELDEVLNSNGEAYSRNYATQYAIADFLLK